MTTRAVVRTLEEPRGRPGELTVGEQEQVGEQVVEPRTSEPTEDDELGRAGGDGRVDRQLGVGRLLVSRMVLDPRPGVRQAPDQVIVGGVEVPDEAIRAAAQAVERGAAAVGGDDEIGLVQPARIGWYEVAGCHDHHPHRSSSKRRQAAASTSFAGMTRIRFEGLRTHRRVALSALSRSPVVSWLVPVSLARAL